MKRALLLFILMTLLTALFACGDGVCKDHTDADKNAICDVCGKKIACEVCKDTDKDAKCDVCKNSIPCKACADENLDALCDVCGGVLGRSSRTEAELYSAITKAGYERSVEDFRTELQGMLAEGIFWHIGDGLPDRTFGMVGDYFLIPASLTVYSRDYNGWSEAYVFSLTDEVTVKFNTGTDQSFAPIEVERGEKVTLPYPERLGFEFLGWQYNDGVDKPIFTEDMAVTKNLTLTAVWRGVFVTYEDFGAVGDGETNDFSALYDTHVYANLNRLTVKAKDGAIYYIGDTRINGKVATIPIKTNTVWGTAKFYVDDSAINYLADPEIAKTDIFTVYPSRDAEKIVNSKTLMELGSTKATATRLPLTLGYDALIVIEDNSHKVFRRYGSPYPSAIRNGYNQSDALLINSIGAISDTSPVTYDYKKCSSATVYAIDRTPITISGGEFTTCACELDAKTAEGSFGSYGRGISIKRSNVTLEGVKHYVTGEIPTERQEEGVEGAAYRGFIYIQYASSVTVKDCVLTARRYYGSGSYELAAHTVIGLTLDGVTQSNFFINEDGTASDTPTEYSSLLYYCGIVETNFSKTVTVKNSIVSSIEARSGLYHGSIVGSKINLITLAGTGSFKISDTEFYSAGTEKSYNSLINLSDELGSTWNGNIEITNVTAHIKDADFHLVYHAYANWDFGYATHIPNILLTDLKIITKNGEADTGYAVKLITTHRSLELEPNIHLSLTQNTHPVRDAESFTEDSASYENLNPVIPPDFINIKSNSHGYIYTVPKSGLWDRTRFISGTDYVTGAVGGRLGDFVFKELSDY